MVSSVSPSCTKTEPSRRRSSVGVLLAMVMAVAATDVYKRQELADRLVNYGIKGFWNFSHYDLAMDYQDIAVENVHLGDSLMTLCYEISEILE